MKFHSEPNLSLDKQNKIGVLLLILGTPTAPTAQAVRPFLREFLSDHRVIDAPKLFWLPLLYGVILPFRSPKSAKNYQKVWQTDGSPILIYTRQQLEGLRKKLPENIMLSVAMTYGKPSVENAMMELKNQGVGRLLVLPLFPQYASSCTGAALDKVWQQMAKQFNQMSLRTISRFYNHPAYVQAAANHIRQFREQNGAAEKLLFSFHSIPFQHKQQGDPYQDECYASAQLIAQSLGLNEQDYLVGFQSRFGRAKWLEPSTQTLLDTLPEQGIATLDVFCPGFVADCLETLEEIAITGKQQFLNAGGKQFHYIPCLNANSEWIDALAELILTNIQDWLPSKDAA